MKGLLKILIFMLLFLPGGARAQPDPQTLFDQGLAEAKIGEYRRAITFFKQALPLYLAKNKGDKAYASGALAAFLQDEESALRQLPPRADWVKWGWLLADPKYSGNWLTPPVEKLPYGGILILARELRRVSFSEGRSIPVWGLVDFKVVPPLQKGETFLQGVCKISATAPLDGSLVAIVSTQGRENAELWKGARLAFRMNSKTGKIEEVSPTEILCQNEALGL